MRALIVDDSRFVRGYLRGLLEVKGIECEEAADGQAGLDRLTGNGPFDIALVDWNMPVMNGIEFLQAVRSQPGSSAFKMLMVTTASDLSHINTAIEAGANEYLMKPFTKEAMVSKLQMLGILEA